MITVVSPLCNITETKTMMAQVPECRTELVVRDQQQERRFLDRFGHSTPFFLSFQTFSYYLSLSLSLSPHSDASQHYSDDSPSTTRGGGLKSQQNGIFFFFFFLSSNIELVHIEILTMTRRKGSLFLRSQRLSPSSESSINITTIMVIPTVPHHRHLRRQQNRQEKG
jgi:hypothetical protein